MKRESIDFSRFIIHLRYFVIRNLNSSQRKNEINDKEFQQLYTLALSLYPFENQILYKIKTMLQEDHQMNFGNSEDFYLLLHLVRIVSEEGGKEK